MGWLAIRLSDEVRVDIYRDQIAADLRRQFGEDVELYIPVHTEEVHGKVYAMSVFEGYVFVRKSSVEDLTRLSVRNLYTSYLDGVLRQDDGTLYILPDEEIGRFQDEGKARAESFLPSVGDTVTPVIGVFKDLPGQVVDVDSVGKRVRVLFRTRAREVVTWEKCVNIKPVQDAPQQDKVDFTSIFDMAEEDRI